MTGVDSSRDEDHQDRGQAGPSEEEGKHPPGCQSDQVESVVDGSGQRNFRIISSYQSMRDLGMHLWIQQEFGWYRSLQD
jgi:hypothetical protein